MSNATITGLIQFIQAQRADRPVFHDDGWSSCAVGDYAVEVLHLPIETADDLIPVVCALWKEDGSSCAGVLPLEVAILAGRDFKIPRREEPGVMDVLVRSHRNETYGNLCLRLGLKQSPSKKPSVWGRMLDWIR